MKNFRKCETCGSHGHGGRACPVYRLNQQQERRRAQRRRDLSFGLTPELEREIILIRKAWKIAAALGLLLLCATSLFAGTITGRLQTATGGAVTNGTLSFRLSQPAVLVGSASLVTSPASCYISAAGNIVGVPDPLVAPVLTANTISGTLPAGTYFVVVTYAGASGESVASPESTVVLSAQGTVIVAAPVKQPSNATGYNVYIGTRSGGETLQASVTGFTQYSQTSALGSGAALPASNSSVCSLAFSDQLIPSGTYYAVNLVNKNGSTIAGFPQTWCTFGGQAGVINVSNGAPTGNCGTNGVFYPTPIMANPPNNAPQSISGPMTFTGNLTLQGTVLANGLTLSAINNVLFVGEGQYPTLASALTAVPSSGGSVIVVPSGYRETFTSHYDLGNGTTKAVILQLSNDVILTCNVTDGTYCFTGHEAGGIIGVRSEVVNVDRSGGSVISIASTANVANVIQTGENPQGSLTLSGFTIDNVNGGAVSNAAVNLVNLNDSSTIRDVKASYFPHIGLHISTTTGGVKSIGPLNIDNCYFDGVSRAGARPLVIESDGSGATNQVNVMGGFYLNAGSSLADIEINGGGNTQGALQQILISGVYTQQAAPSTAVTGIKIVDAAGVTVQTSSFQVTDATAGHTGISINQSGAGRTHSINVQNFRLDSGGGNIGLNNLITTTTVLNAVGSGNIPGYIYGGSVGTQTPSPFIFDDVQVTINGNNIRQTIGSGTSTSNGTAIGSGVSQAQPAITISGATTGDVATCSLNAAPVATWQTGIQFLLPVVTANTVTPWLSNPTAGSITPVAAVIRCSVSR